MPNSFTQLWKEDEIHDRDRLRHVASNDFKRLDVQVGDFIYGFIARDRRLLLVARMQVEAITDAEGAAKMLSRSTIIMAEKETHCVCSAERGTPMVFDREVPSDVLRQLRFQTKDDESLVKFNPDGNPAMNAMRTSRRLMPESADILDSLIDPDDEDGTTVSQVPVKLSTIKTFDELADNFNTFQRDARNHRDRATNLLRQTKYWVHDTNSGAFGPGKFLGFRKMDFLNYDLAKLGQSEGAHFQGSISKNAIQNVLERKFERDSPRDDACRLWGESLLGPDAFGNANSGKWKFISLAMPGRESTSPYPDDVTQPERFPEGALLTVTVNKYERNPKARQKCIDHYGAKCQVCKLSFPERYEGLGDGFIHVHHLKLVSNADGEYEVDPIKDLRPVCPNCHAMLHRTNPPILIDDLRKKLLM